MNVGSTSECAVEHTHGVIARLFNSRDHMPPDQQAASAMGALSTAQCPSAQLETPRKCAACNAPLKGKWGDTRVLAGHDRRVQKENKRIDQHG